MKPSWFKARGYRHFDVPVGDAFLETIEDPKVVQEHGWVPLISFVKETKRYRPAEHKTKLKPRTIMYASHRDASVFARYASMLNEALDARYATEGLDEVVVAYRKLSKSNYDFAAKAAAFARKSAPCVILCFDVTGFFDSLDHGLLKRELMNVLGTPAGLSDDWYAVFKAATKFRHVEMQALRADPKIGPRVGGRSPTLIATIAEVKGAGIPIIGNPNKFGIPQGTPISAALSNLYMHPLDAKLHAACSKVGALYRRYSDDLLIICPPEAEADLVAALKAEISARKLTLNDDKTERVVFDGTNPNAFQYLGFIVSQDDAGLRSASLARQWRKAKRSIRRTERAGVAAREAGTATKTFTKKLRRRFLPSGVRNFSSYARRSADAFGSKTMVRQVLRLERMVEKAIKRMK